MRQRLPKPLVLLIIAAAFLAGGEAAAKQPARGERVQFTGLVTDRAGQPLEQVQVILEAARSKFLARRLRREVVDTFRVSAVTNARGEYGISWPWNDYYNRYELLVAVPYRRGNQEQLQILARFDVTDKVDEGNPVVTALVVKDTTFLNTLRRFLASLDSDDERKAYQQMGKPDKVEQVGNRGEAESSWWYFAAGKVLRFRGGKLLKEDLFDPIEQIP